MERVKCPDAGQVHRGELRPPTERAGDQGEGVQATDRLQR